MELARSVFRLQMDIRQFMDKLVHVEKLMETFEDMPKIKGYLTGNEFIFRNGDISLKNMSYSYGENTVFQRFSLEIA